MVITEQCLEQCLSHSKETTPDPPPVGSDPQDLETHQQPHSRLSLEPSIVLAFRFCGDGPLNAGSFSQCSEVNSAVRPVKLALGSLLTWLSPDSTSDLFRAFVPILVQELFPQDRSSQNCISTIPQTGSANPVQRLLWPRATKPHSRWRSQGNLLKWFRD